MLSIEKLATRENTETITFRGAEVTVRGLTLADRALVDDIYLPPANPGEDAAEADTVAYRRAINECVAGRMAAVVAIGLDWQLADGKTWQDVRHDVGIAKQFLRKCGEEFVQANLSRAEVDEVIAAVDRIEGRGTRAAETARKN